MKESIYLNHSARSIPSKNSLMAAFPYYEELFVPYKDIEEAEHAIKAFVGAGAEDQFVFTSSGQEAHELVIQSAYHALTKLGGKNHFVASSFDAAVVALEDEGCYLKLAPPSSDGFVIVDAIIDALSPRTAIVSLPWASGSTGVIQPIDEIAKICQERAIWLHLDATHVVGKQDFSFKDLPVDILTFSGHSLGAPLGTGAVFAKPHIQLRPLVHKNPLNLPMLMALKEACRQAEEVKSLYCLEVSRLRLQFEEKLGAALYTQSDRVPHIVKLAFKGLHPEFLAFVLAKKGVHVGWDDEGITCSMTHETDEASLDRAAQIIADTVKRLSKGIL